MTSAMLGILVEPRAQAEARLPASAAPTDAAMDTETSTAAPPSSLILHRDAPTEAVLMVCQGSLARLTTQASNIARHLVTYLSGFAQEVAADPTRPKARLIHRCAPLMPPRSSATSST